VTTPTPMRPPAVTGSVQPEGQPNPKGKLDWSTLVANRNNKFTAAYFGQAGEGKSHNLATWPNPVVFVFDPNQATLTGLIDPRRVINLASEDGYRTFYNLIRHKVFNRDLKDLEEMVGGPIETVGLDSFTFMYDLMQGAVPIPTTNQGDDNTMAWYRQLNVQSENILRQFCSIAQPYATDPTRPAYNFVCTLHQKDEVKQIGSGKNTQVVLDRYVPRLEGRIKNSVLSFFDTVLLCRYGKIKIDGKDVERHYCYSVPPDRYYPGIKDGVGGGGKRFAQLPKIIGGTYPELAKAWGLNTEGGE